MRAAAAAAVVAPATVIMGAGPAAAATAFVPRFIDVPDLDSFYVSNWQHGLNWLQLWCVSQRKLDSPIVKVDINNVNWFEVHQHAGIFMEDSASQIVELILS